MKRYLLTAPVAALMCGAVFAQTSVTLTDKAAASDGTYGTTWSGSTGAMFYSDAEMTKMRTPEEVGARWSALSQEDRDAVLAECTRYRTDSGTTAATGTTETATGAEATTKTEGAATGGTATASMGVSAEKMKMICDMAEGY